MSSRPPISPSRERRSVFERMAESTRRRILGLGRSDPGGSPETAVSLDPISAGTSHLTRYGFDNKMMHPRADSIIRSPFVQDTLRALISRDLPSYGMARAPFPEDVHPLGSIKGFVANETPGRVNLMEWGTHRSDPFDVSGTIAHETIHSAEGRGDPELLDLMGRLKPIWREKGDELVAKLQSGEVKAGDIHPWTLYSLENTREHLAYSMEMALAWVRKGEDPEELERMEKIVPGVGIAAEYVKQRLSGLNKEVEENRPRPSILLKQKD